MNCAKRYNRGKCNYGINCKYEHKCSYCHKFGHGVLSCRKLSADKEYRNNNRRDSGNFKKLPQTPEKRSSPLGSDKTGPTQIGKKDH